MHWASCAPRDSECLGERLPGEGGPARTWAFWHQTSCPVDTNHGGEELNPSCSLVSKKHLKENIRRLLFVQNHVGENRTH